MKKLTWGIILLCLSTIPSVSFAKGLPLFFQTGDELFEVEGAPTFEDGYSVGYACKRFGLFGADIWTWDCHIMAVNLEDFSAGNLDPEVSGEMESLYPLSDRKRNPWNHYGAVVLSLVLVGSVVAKTKS